MRRGRLVTALAALIVAAVAAGAPLAARAQSKVEIRVAALTLPVFNPIIVNIMREKGFDARHGLDVEVRPFPSISAFYAAFATGEVDTTVVGGPGADTFNVAAAGPTGLTLDGEEDCDTYNITFGALAGPVTVSDSGADDCDVLTVDCQGAALTHTPTSSTSGNLSSNGESIDYSGIETVSFLNCAVPTLTALATWLMAGMLAVTGWSRLKRNKQAKTA